MEIVNLLQNIECGKCYRIKGTLTEYTEEFDIVFGSWNGISFLEIGVAATLTEEGDFNILFDSHECGELTTVVNALRYPSAQDLHITELRIDETCQDYICSECVELVEVGCENYKLVEYWNNSDAFELRYDGVNFRQQILLPASIEASSYPYPVEENFKLASGNKVNLLIDSESVEEMLIEPLPDYLHDAIRLALVHDNLFIEGQKYFKLDGDYQPEFDKNNGALAHVTVDIQKLNQNKKSNFV